MDPFSTELESMATNCAAVNPGAEISPQTISRWQRLFNYTHTEAAEKIRSHRAYLFLTRFSDTNWEFIREENERQGHDKESYEHSLSLAQQSSATHRDEGGGEYLLKLGGAYSTLPDLISISGLHNFPHAPTTATDGDGNISYFIQIDASTKTALQQLPVFAHAIFVRINMAAKDLSSTSLYPTLGIDTTLPQFRLADNERDDGPRPAQDEYPVWYFFYGTLACADELSKQCRIPECSIELKDVSITHGIVRTWGRKYKALAAGTEKDVVSGWAYWVKKKEHEDAMRVYETDKYEVVRCWMDIDGVGKVRGLTFKFVDNGGVDERDSDAVGEGG